MEVVILPGFITLEIDITATDILFLILVHVKRNREYLFIETKYILAEKFL